MPYAEDQALALDMLRAGYAKAYVPDAAVIHSHEYGAASRSSGARSTSGAALREVHGWVEPASPVAPC